MRRRPVLTTLLLTACLGLTGCEATEEPAASPASPEAAAAEAEPSRPEPQYRLTRDQTHNKWSAAIEPVLRVPSGAVLEIETEEASDGQITPESGVEAVVGLDFDPIHPLTGPVYVEGAQPGDVLKVTLHSIELGDWGWSAVAPGFGFLADEFTEPYLTTWRFEPGQTHADFAGMKVPLEPFPGVVGVAPDTTERLSTIPPRAHGGNMDDKDLTEGAVVYLPVFVPGALFSIGDAHAAQGDGEVSGTAIEAPTTIVLQLDLIQGGRQIPEPQYETADAYVVTAFGETLDEAARKATRYMIDYLEAEHGMERTEAYVLASLAADLKISEVVDVPHVLVAMRLPKEVYE